VYTPYSPCMSTPLYGIETWAICHPTSRHHSQMTCPRWLLSDTREQFSLRANDLLPAWRLLEGLHVAWRRRILSCRSVGVSALLAPRKSFFYFTTPPSMAIKAQRRCAAAQKANCTRCRNLVCVHSSCAAMLRRSPPDTAGRRKCRDDHVGNS